MKQELLETLNKIFTSTGYNVTKSYRCDFITEKDGQKTFIKLETYIDENKLKRFANRIKGDKGIFIIADTIEPHFYKIASNLEIYLWNHDDLSIRIGRAMLADIEGTLDELDLIEPIQQMIPDRFEKLSKQSQNILSICEDDFSDVLKSDESAEKESTTEFMTELALKPITEPITEPIMELTPSENLSTILKLNSLPVKISIDDAKAIARPYVNDIKNINLKFVPFWDYNYIIRYSRNYKSKTIDVKGENYGNINAINGQETEIYFTDLKNQVLVPNDDYEIKTPLITKNEMENRLVEMLIRKYTRTIKFNESAKQVIITESKTFKPKNEEIILTYNLKYLPVWEIEGSKNTVEINGYDSEILEMPSDNGVEFV